MGTWSVDTQRKPGVLWLELRGVMALEEMQAFVAAHNTAIDRLGGAPYAVFCDIRELSVLTLECADLFESGKSYSDSHDNFCGSGTCQPR